MSFSAMYCEQCGSLFSRNIYVESDVCVRSPLVCQSGIGSSTLAGSFAQSLENVETISKTKFGKIRDQ